MFIYFYTQTTCVHTLNVKDLYMLREDLSKNAYLDLRNRNIRILEMIQKFELHV